MNFTIEKIFSDPHEYRKKKNTIKRNKIIFLLFIKEVDCRTDEQRAAASQVLFTYTLPVTNASYHKLIIFIYFSPKICECMCLFWILRISLHYYKWKLDYLQCSGA